VVAEELLSPIMHIRNKYRANLHPSTPRNFLVVLLILFSAVSVVPGLNVQQEPAPAADRLPVQPDMPCSAVVTPEPYTVPLSDAQENRAQAVYKKSIVITAHDHCFHPDDFRDQERAGITVRTIKLTTDGIYWQDAARHKIESEVDGWMERGQMAIEILRKNMAAAGGKAVVVRSVDDIRRAKQQGQQGVIISFEGGRPLQGKLENLKNFYEKGLRDMQLFWAVSSPLKTRDNRFSDFGLQVIQEMNRLGIVADFSHLRAPAFDQAISTTRDPIVVSHCAVKAVSGADASGGTDHLNDDTIRAIAKNGGVICLHFYQGYIRPHRSTRSSVEDLADHADYIRQLVGIDHVALGVDFFPEKGAPWIRGAEQMGGMINVARELVRRGYTDAEIEKVLGGNLMRVYERVWKR
jgi:membrane dipeptidase